MTKRLTVAQKDALTQLADNGGRGTLSQILGSPQTTRTRSALEGRGYIQWTGREYRLTARGHMALLDGPEEANAANFVYDVNGE